MIHFHQGGRAANPSITLLALLPSHLICEFNCWLTHQDVSFDHFVETSNRLTVEFLLAIRDGAWNGSQAVRNELLEVELHFKSLGFSLDQLSAYSEINLSKGRDVYETH